MYAYMYVALVVIADGETKIVGRLVGGEMKYKYILQEMWGNATS